MIESNTVIIEFVSGNWIGITLSLGILKVIAKLTPWSEDDSLVEMIRGVFREIRSIGRRKADPIM